MTDVVGYFPYLNVWPFVQGLPEGVERVVAPPRVLAAHARAGRVDVGILPWVEVPALEGRYTLLGDFGLAVAGPVGSVLLLSRRPIEALSGARICPTPESSTSVRLLTLLLRTRYGVRDWVWWPTPDEADAWLVIGDAALAITLERRGGEGVPSWRGLAAATRPARRFSWVYDLAEEWTRWQGLPFVFAVWVVRRDGPSDLRDRWHRHWTAVLEAYLPRLHGGGPTDGLSEAEVAYLRRFRYRLGPEEWAGARRFLEMMADCVRRTGD